MNIADGIHRNMLKAVPTNESHKVSVILLLGNEAIGKLAENGCSLEGIEIVKSPSPGRIKPRNAAALLTLIAFLRSMREGFT